MSDYVLIADSTVDLPAEILEEIGVPVIPMDLQVGEDSYKHYPDARELSFHDFYNRLDNGDMASTAQINAYTYIENFEPYLKAGKDVIYLSFSSGLSNTYTASLLVAEQLMEQYPGRRVKCIDSLSCSGGIGFLVYHAMEKKAEGYDFDQLVAWIEENRTKVAHWFTLYDINYLRRSGRVSILAAGLASMLSIKPVLHVDDTGFLVAVSKARGRKKSLDQLVDHMVATAVNPEEQTIVICHGDRPEDWDYVADQIMQRVPVKRIIKSYIGPIIGAHCGPGVFSIFFWASER